eukprot:6577712-Heterocapsa_arctica.AAC.1
MGRIPYAPLEDVFNCLADHRRHGAAEVPFQDRSRCALLVRDQAHVQLGAELALVVNDPGFKILDQLAIAMQGGA